MGKIRWQCNDVKGSHWKEKWPWVKYLSPLCWIHACPHWLSDKYILWFSRADVDPLSGLLHWTPDIYIFIFYLLWSCCYYHCLVLGFPRPSLWHNTILIPPPSSSLAWSLSNAFPWTVNQSIVFSIWAWLWHSFIFKQSFLCKKKKKKNCLKNGCTKNTHTHTQNIWVMWRFVCKKSRFRTWNHVISMHERLCSGDNVVHVLICNVRKNI